MRRYCGFPPAIQTTYGRWIILYYTRGILQPFPGSIDVIPLTHHVITATGVPNAQPDVALVVDRRGIGELVRLE